MLQAVILKKLTPMELKESIFKSEGRVIMGQHLLFAGEGLVRGITNSEVMFAFGADMVMLNTMDLDNMENNKGLQGLSYQTLRQRCKRPLGIYLGCPKAGFEDGGKKALYRREGMLCTPETCSKNVLTWELILLFWVVNPGSGTSINDVIACTKWIKEKYGDQLFVFAGKMGRWYKRKRCSEILLANRDAKRDN